VADDAVALHLAEAQAAVARAALHRLSRQDLDRTAAPGVNLVVHHVLQPLVVRRAEEDLRLQLPPRVPIVHGLPPATLVPAPAAHDHTDIGGRSATLTRSP